MPITVLGMYDDDQPITKEEREEIIPVIKDEIEKNSLMKLVMSLQMYVTQSFSQTRLFHPSHSLEPIAKETNDRILLVGIPLFRSSKGFMYLEENKDNLLCTVTKDEDGVPVIVLSEWLQGLFMGTIVPEFKWSEITDGFIVNKINDILSRDPSLCKVPEEMKPLVEFNNKLNEIADDYTYGGGFNIDFTPVIQSIIQAVKEGKL